MTFAIDFDGTFSRAPEIFREFVRLARAAGHDCVLVTGRSDDDLWGSEVRDLVGDLMPIVFAGHRWKREAAKKRGWNVDVWIDDNPEYVGPQQLVGGHG